MERAVIRWRGLLSMEEASPPPQQRPVPWQRSSPYNDPLLFVIPSVPGFPASMLSPAIPDVVLFKENHTQPTEAASLERKSGAAEGSAVRHSCAPPLPANNLHQSSTESSWKHHPSPLLSRVIMGERPTYEDENGFYLATTLPGSAALPFVISTGAERSLCGCLFLEMFFDGAKPTDLQFSLSSRTRSLTSEAVPGSTMPFLQARGRPAYRRRPRLFLLSRGLQIQPRMDRSPAIPTGAKPRSRDNNYR
jgi:hypothetical protein